MDIKLISYIKGFEDGVDYLIVEIDGEQRMFESMKGKIYWESEDESTRRDSGC